MWAAGIGSDTTGSSGLASAAGASVAAAGSAAGSAGFSVLGELLPLTVARSLANGDNGFSPSSSLVVFSFLVNHGRELLRLSFLTTGVSAALVSPFATAVVSVGTVAGDATAAANGSVDSTAIAQLAKGLQIWKSSIYLG